LSVIVDHQVKKVKRILEFIARPNKLDLADFLNWENKKWSEVNKTEENYYSTLSWAMIFFIKSRTDGDDILRSILLDLKKGQSSKITVTNNYPGGINNLENDLINFFRKEFSK